MVKISRRKVVIGALAGTALAKARPAVNVAALPGGGIQPQIVVKSNVLHLVYYKGDARHGDLFYCTSNDHGGTFSAEKRVNSESGSAIAAGTIRGAQIAVGRAGRVHVAWNGSAGSPPNGSPMLYSHFDSASETFQPQRNLMRKTRHLDGGGSVAADEKGNVFVAWHGNATGGPEGEADRKVWIAKSFDEGAGFGEEQPAWNEPTGACGCCGMSIFAASDGTVYGLYRSATNNVNRDIYLLESRDAGHSFKGQLLDKWNVNACPMSSMFFANADNGVLMGWETANEVYCSDVRRSFTIHPTGPAGKRKHPAVARNAQGDMLLTWVEGSGWQRAGSLGWELFDRHGRSLERNARNQPIPVWSFAAPIAKPNGDFTIWA